MIKAIIFDFAGVIATDTYWIWLRKIEDFLDIRLREKIEGTILRQRVKKKLDLTLGDVVEVS